MCTRLFIPLLACLAWPDLAAGQARWTLTAELGATTFSSAAHDTSSPPFQLRAFRPISYSLRLTREGRRVGMALGLSYLPSALAGTVEEIAFVQGGQLELFEIAPEVRWILGTTSAGATVVLHTGPIVDVWGVAGGERRLRAGGSVGATLALPLTERWRFDVRSDLALTRSFLTAEEEAPDLTRTKSMRRARLALGLARRL